MSPNPTKREEEWRLVGQLGMKTIDPDMHQQVGKHEIRVMTTSILKESESKKWCCQMVVSKVRMEPILKWWTSGQKYQYDITILMEFREII